MRITVFGAAGSVGSRVVAEALERGHEVRAVVRRESQFGELPDEAEHQLGDASKVDDVSSLSAGQDVVVSATRPAPGREADLVETTKALLAGVRGQSARLVIVGGAASLKLPGTGGKRVLDDPSLVPPAWQPIAQACSEQLAVCREEAEVDWTYLSPPAFLESGPRLGVYRVGDDELIVDAEGLSRISVPDLASALMDEVEQPSHQRGRFTAGY